MASVGVWTRPAGVFWKPPIALVFSAVRARVELMPTSQSASLRDVAAAASGSISSLARRCAKASRIESAVMLWSQRRLSGCFAPDARMMLRKMSSPSRPASQALMMSLTSLRLINFLSSESRAAFFSMGASANSGGRCGSFSMVHLPRAISCSLGTASSSRWPTALEMTYRSSSKKSAAFFTPSTRAISAATLGFSAMTKVFPMTLH